LLEFLHLAVVDIVSLILPVVFIFEEEVKEVAIFVEGVVFLVVVHCTWQAEEIMDEIRHPTFVLLFWE
jgi:hypothetical protein